MCWKYGWLFLLEFPNSSVLIGRSSEWLTQIQSAKTTPLVLCLDLGNTPSFKENTFLFYLLCLYIQKCQRRKKKQKTTLTNKEIHENLNKQTNTNSILLLLLNTVLWLVQSSIQWWGPTRIWWCSFWFLYISDKTRRTRSRNSVVYRRNSIILQ